MNTTKWKINLLTSNWQEINHIPFLFYLRFKFNQKQKLIYNNNLSLLLNQIKNIELKFLKIEGWQLLPALVTLEDILATIATNPRIGRNTCTTPGTLKSFSSCLQVIIKICIFYHQITSYNWNGKFNLKYK